MPTISEKRQAFRELHQSGIQGDRQQGARCCSAAGATATVSAAYMSSSMPTGQWSLLMTELSMNARRNRGRRSSLTIT